MKQHTKSKHNINKDLTNKDLHKLLQYTENITLDDREFNNLFKEQENILCDIKSILTKGQVTCETNIKNKLHSKKFINNYNNFKQNYYHTQPTPNISNNAVLNGAVIIKNVKNLKKTTKNMPHKKMVILQKM